MWIFALHPGKIGFHIFCISSFYTALLLVGFEVLTAVVLGYNAV
jgi:hypothetical protein